MSGIADVVQHYAQRNMADIKNNWDKSKAFGYGIVDGNAEINFKITSDTPALITGEYRASGQKMWILEYGSGSNLDKSNLWLSDYISSDKFNPIRAEYGFAIRTRFGSYRDLDNNEHQGANVNYPYGINLEAKTDRSYYRVMAQEPQHIIEETLSKDTAINRDFKQSLLVAVGESIRTNIRRVL